jgi:outer membrane translocation and assembly module TamA
LQWLFNVKSYLFNGKAGIVGFYDYGRVWQPAEKSKTWHNGYGGGIIIAPFNKIMASVTYGISKENNLLHLKLSKNF